MMPQITHYRCRLHLYFSLLFLLLILPGCQLFSLPSTQQASADNQEEPSSQIDTIYIQSFAGESVSKVQEVFFETVEEQDVFTFVELLPENYINLKILRLEVIDYAIWETEEHLTKETLKLRPEASDDTQMKRRNAIVSMKISLYEAETGQLLIRKLYSQPFQQIYIGAKSIEERPSKDLELRRLTKILVFNILTDFYRNNNSNIVLDLEKGQGYDWISLNLYNIGDKRITKGNRLAKAGDFQKAIWMWQLVLFRPGKEEPLEVYKLNRAAAYHNLGVVFGHLDDWLMAAKMFSMANRLEQKLKYAQSWGNNMQLWLESQKSQTGQIDRIDELKARRKALALSKPDLTDAREKELSKADILGFIERNQQLLLNPKELWPLEPALKYAEPIKTELQQPVELPDETVPLDFEDETTETQDSDLSESSDDLIRRITE